MRIAFDIGGCISKYPDVFRQLITKLKHGDAEVFIITDMHDRDEVLRALQQNQFGFVPAENVYCADYERHGELCKAKLLRDLKIDIFIDDFVGYCQWDSALGEAPIRLLVMPDGFKPYWAESWKCEGQDFGRRVASKEQL